MMTATGQGKTREERDMGKTAVSGYDARGDTYSMDPDKLKIITDKADPFYEDRANLPMDSAEMQWLIESMTETANDPQSRNCGNVSEVLIRKDGKHSDGTDNLVVVDGRQRVRAAREINRRYRELGKEPILVKCTYRLVTNEKDAMKLAMMRNECRVQTPPSIMAIHIDKMVGLGHTWEEIQRTFARPEKDLRELLKIVSLCDEVRGAVDAGKISVAAAAKLKDMGIQEQRVAIRELVESGERITAKKAAQRAATAPDADGGIPPPKVKLPRPKTRAAIEKRIVEVGDSKIESIEGSIYIHALRWVLGEVGDEMLSLTPIKKEEE
jgi:ParB family chromosome partitioning protein